MTLKIATWNLCLGLFHKKDYVRTLLYENNIDILTLQETELSPELQLENLQIKGYSIEVENNNKKRRVAIYIKNSISYKRRVDLEKENLHIIILDVESSPPARIITIYRTFNPQCGCTPRENFRKQLNTISNATTTSTILLGDFNLDENKRHSADYNQRLLFQDLEELIGHHHYDQHVKEATWERVIQDQVKNSILDHIYCTDNTIVGNVLYKDTIYGDHKMVILCTSNERIERDFKIQRRNWRKYSMDVLIQNLSLVRWGTDVDSIQEMWNSFEQEILTIVDKIAPLEEVGSTIKRKVSKTLKSKLNRRSYLLNKRKHRTQQDHEKEELKALNKYIRNYYYEERRMHVRSKIIPGNNKSLWDAVKIARDIEPTPLPAMLTRDGINYDRKTAPEAFSKYFKTKISTLEEGTTIDEEMWNGEKIINSESINFMTPERVEECLKNLKSKNCEGPDRLPLRILKDGATVLAKPLSVLFCKIYEKKEIPEQWKVSKVIPLHKKGKKENIENYRPISNLCSITKVFERLILLRLEEIEKENGIDLTGYEQHGFKKKRSTVTAGLTLQSLIAKEMDMDCYVAMSSLDLSAAFDLVNLDLLMKRLKIMGIPDDLLQLLEVWLRQRSFYVEANGQNSSILENDVGTIQGSILGPILYALFIRPLYKITKVTTFADDNYVVKFNKDKKMALEELKKELEKIIKWLKGSGLKVNEKKTELCIFHRNGNTDGNLLIDNDLITSKNEINVLGITFDSKLQWSSQVSRAIGGANKALQAIKLIRKYFTTPEIVQLLTSNFYSRFYYGSEIWHIPTLNRNCKKMLLSASANALKLCNIFYDPSVSYIDLHTLHKRALPSKFCLYRHCLLLHKVFNDSIPKRDWIDLNFQMRNTSRQTSFETQNCSVYKVGNNILSNRLTCINKKVPLNILNLDIGPFKVICKNMFLK
jgi:exonuclease III